MRKINDIFRGIHTALITPFTSIGAVDIGSFKRLVEYQIASGIDGLVPCGTTGEGYFRLSAFGHRENIEEAVSSLKKNLRL